MSEVDPAHRQQGARIRMEWGPTGAHALAPGSYAVVVDVLSFTTTLTVATERGITVWPFAWKDQRAAAYAAGRDAVLAVGRLEAGRDGAHGVSLSPAAMSRVEGLDRLVLPSPNGSAIAALLAGSEATVVAGCLRNASAVADWVAGRLAPAESVVVIAAGERWPDGTLRPAVEDLWGAGAVVAGLLERGVAEASPEARVAAAAFRAVRPRLAEDLIGCASGQELVAAGFADDVRIAAELDASAIVPVLSDDAFRAAGPS